MEMGTCDYSWSFFSFFLLFFLSILINSFPHSTHPSCTLLHFLLLLLLHYLAFALFCFFCFCTCSFFPSFLANSFSVLYTPHLSQITVSVAQGRVQSPSPQPRYKSYAYTQAAYVKSPEQKRRRFTEQVRVLQC